jgi:D-arabinose 1-dehydrogenase-like Zn-dependent alcohol dehydrogenase
MTHPTAGRVAVFSKPNAPFQVESYPLRAPGPREALVRVSMSTICRSDIHSYQGHRPSPCPGLLGHEIVGRIVALGQELTCDMRGEILAIGDRITWSEFFIPHGNYFTDVLDLPQKSPGVEKYGHMAVTTAPHHHGGFAEYCYVLPKSWILRLPDKMVTLRGIHNYHPRHLVEALDFVVANKTRYPFSELVDARYPLDQVTQAMADASSQRVLRAAIVPLRAKP